MKSYYIKVKVIPNAKSNEIVEKTEDENGIYIKIRIKSKAEKNKANIDLIKLLSKEFTTSTDNIKIISGKNQRTKLLKIEHE